MSDLASVLPVPPRALPVRHRRPAEALHLRRMRREASDEELMLRYGKGDAGAFEALYRRHRLPLYRFLLRQVGSAESAEELFQDLWMRVVNSRGRYEVRAKFTSWVYAIAHNRLMDFYRANGRASFLSHEESESVLEDLPAGEIAAAVLVTFTLALMVFERESGLDTMAPKAPRADRPAKVSPAEPVRAGQLAKSPPAEPRSAAPAPATPSPQAAAPPDRAKPPTVETALSSERRATGRPVRVPAVPPGIEILRKSEEVKPLPDAQRAFDVQQSVRPTQAPAAAPAPGANSLRESASTLQGAGAVGGATSRAAVSEAKERTPEKWLEDIRKLKTEGKATEVERELAEFKKRDPDYILPEDLR